MAESTIIGRLSLLAPVTGVLVPIEKVPDPVFAGKMVGDGVSIDPFEGVLVAPCSGQVIHVHPSGHALTIRTPDGVEVLTHIGLDTVKMRGEGFDLLVSNGDEVSAGQRLITFDLDLVATQAKSLLTQMVVANSDMLSAFEPATGVVTAGEDVAAVATLAAAGEKAAGTAELGRKATSRAVVIPNPQGLHARPAAVLSKTASGFDSQIWIARGDDKANAKSVMAIMGLEVGYGDTVRIVASGSDAETAAGELIDALENGLGEEGVSALPPGAAATIAAAEAAQQPEPGPEPERRSEDPNLLVGVSASPGIGVGRIVQIRRADILVAESSNDDRHGERRKLNDAIDRAQVQLNALQERMAEKADTERAAIFGAHREILRDPDLLDLAVSGIDKGKTAAYAWRGAYEGYAERLSKLKNEVLAGRAIDVRDVGQRVLQELTGASRDEDVIPEGSILVAEDLTPSDTAAMDPSRVAGFCTTGGGASSHVAILARSMDIPAVAGIEPAALQVGDGMLVVLDGTRGTVRLNVTEDEAEQVRERQRWIAVRRAHELEHAEEPATTRDGHTVEVVANIGGLQDAQQASTKGAEGVGLLRSEFIFLERRDAPGEDEQAALYTDIGKALRPGQAFVVRTLDVGGDKPLPYLPIPPEENPFLGERGIRVGLSRPDVLRTQVRAILRSTNSGARVHIMFPMIATIEDFRRAKAVVEEQRSALGVDPVPVGIMVEVPSAAVMAAQFAEEADFFSVGTNDLTQYTLAMDRGHPKLAPQCDGLNPAVLGLIALAVKGAHAHGKWVGVCGGLGSDPQAVPILLGIGVDELSVSVPAIPSVKAQIRALSLPKCRELAEKALAARSAAEVRELVPLDDGPEPPSAPASGQPEQTSGADL